MTTTVTDESSPSTPQPAAPPRPPGLEVIQGPGAPQFHPLEPQITLVGRARFCHLRATGAGVSHVHCLIIRNATHYLIRDLGSRSGTFLSGDRVSEAVLQDGDELTIGPLSLRVCLPEVLPAPADGSDSASADGAAPDSSAHPEPGSDAAAASSQQLRDELAELARREERFHMQLAEFEADTRSQRLLLADSAAALRKQWKELEARQAALEAQAARLADHEASLHEQAQSLAAASRQHDTHAARQHGELQSRCDELERLCATLESRKAQLEAALRERLARFESAKRRSDERLEQHEDALQGAIEEMLDVGAALAGPLVAAGR